MFLYQLNVWTLLISIKWCILCSYERLCITRVNRIGINKHKKDNFESIFSSKTTSSVVLLPDKFCRVVEGPLELNLCWVGFHFTNNIHPLIFWHPIDHWLRACTNRNIWNCRNIYWAQMSPNKKSLTRSAHQNNQIMFCRLSFILIV